jgi:hypothetical protein
MYVYNITIKVDNKIEDEWLLWQKEITIPEMLSTGFFYDYRFFELLGQDVTDGKTFVAQYFALSGEDCEMFTDQYAEHLREKAFKKWGDHFISFRTILKSVH